MHARSDKILASMTKEEKDSILESVELDEVSEMPSQDKKRWTPEEDREYACIQMQLFARRYLLFFLVCHAYFRGKSTCIKQHFVHNRGADGSSQGAGYRQLGRNRAKNANEAFQHPVQATLHQ